MNKIIFEEVDNGNMSGSFGFYVCCLLKRHSSCKIFEFLLVPLLEMATKHRRFFENIIAVLSYPLKKQFSFYRFSAPLHSTQLKAYWLFAIIGATRSGQNLKLSRVTNLRRKWRHKGVVTKNITNVVSRIYIEISLSVATAILKNQKCLQFEHRLCVPKNLDFRNHLRSIFKRM